MSFTDNKSKIRFIVSNHMLYRDAEKFETILKNIGLKVEDFDIACEDWWESVEWWNDEAFVNVLRTSGVNMNKTIKVLKKVS